MFGGPIELFLDPASVPQLVYQRLWYVLSYLWNVAYKRTLAATCKKRSLCSGGSGLLYHYLSAPLCLIPNNQMC